VDDWRANVGRFCSGNSRLILAASCAFAGPVLSLVGGESGGVHFVGATSTGKSTALLVGGSGKRAAVESALRGFQADFLKNRVPAGATGEAFRAAQRFALIAAAGELATGASITGWEEGEATPSRGAVLQILA
jgi:uncharacterized protein (DUF927 family)